MAAEPKPIRPVDEQAKPLALTTIEQHALVGLQARAREYERIINESEREIVAAINERLGIEVGKSHSITPDLASVVPIAAPVEPPKVEEN